jgi:mRNA interferase MazF
VEVRQIPRFGEVWQADLDPAVGHEQAGARPVVIVSVDDFNENVSGLVFVVPVTRRERLNDLHVPVDPSRGGLRHPSFALCEMTRSISVERLRYRIGRVDPIVMEVIADRLRIVLGL